MQNKGVLLFQRFVGIVLLIYGVTLFDIRGTGSSAYLPVIHPYAPAVMIVFFFVSAFLILRQRTPLLLSRFLLYCFPQYLYALVAIRWWGSGNYTGSALYPHPVISLLIWIASWAILKTYQEIMELPHATDT